MTFGTWGRAMQRACGAASPQQLACASQLLLATQAHDARDAGEDQSPSQEQMLSPAAAMQDEGVQTRNAAGDPAGLQACRVSFKQRSGHHWAPCSLRCHHGRGLLTTTGCCFGSRPHAWLCLISNPCSHSCMLVSRRSSRLLVPHDVPSHGSCPRLTHWGLQCCCKALSTFEIAWCDVQRAVKHSSSCRSSCRPSCRAGSSQCSWMLCTEAFGMSPWLPRMPQSRCMWSTQRELL